MPPRLRPVNAETISRRLELRPDTVALGAAKVSYDRLGQDAETDGHTGLATEVFELATDLQDLIDTPEPRGLVASARMIQDMDGLVLRASDLRANVAGAYDRFDSHTAWATEAMEILIATVVKLEAADLELRTGTRAA
ncbi:hypothetical protein GCM10023063_15420 [Arthrobacter methylotrophus]|uniref:Uncharacterized protein n=1 Tax=Arthrobacter methylotrophus TaxID=121291 RepID=A0ABV5UR75_9MICC